MLAQAPSTKSERVFHKSVALLLLTAVVHVAAEAECLDIHTGLNKNFNFLIFNFFKKILSRGHSPAHPSQSQKVLPRLGQPSRRSLSTKHKIRHPFTHPLPKARSLRSLTFDKYLVHGDSYSLGVFHFCSGSDLAAR